MPSLSPIQVKGSPITQQMVAPASRYDTSRDRFFRNPNWPILKSKHYYLEDKELMTAMVKGRGNLRDILTWIAENFDLDQRRLQYDMAMAANHQAEEQKQRNGHPATMGYPPQMVAQPPHAHQLPMNFVPPMPQHQMAPQYFQFGPPPVEDDQSPMKGMARQKRPVPMAVPVAPDTKVHLQKPKMGILDKYRQRQQRVDLMLKPSPQVKRRLVQADEEYGLVLPVPAPVPGALNAHFAYRENVPFNYPVQQPVAATQEEQVESLEAMEERIRQNRRKHRLKSRLEDDFYDDDVSADEDSHEYHLGVTSIDHQVVEFLNSGAKEDIMDICNVQPDVADLVISHRPYSSIYLISEEKFAGDTPEPQVKRRGPRKALGLKIVEATASSLKGYKAVDSLVQQCSQYAEQISQQLQRWGVNVTGEGEMDVVDVDLSHVDLGADPVVALRHVQYIVNKPELLGEDVQLKSYQQVGINWLNLLYRNGWSCILADEMGLGKTCQVIAFMAHLKATSDKKRPHMVVVPASTLENWLREFEKFCPDLVVQAYYGSQPEREDLRYELDDAHYDVLVTTYNLATGSPNDVKWLRRIDFDMIVYDEGHMLKNSNSERYAKLMRMRADFRLLLTGTPLQNNLKELVSLLAFMLPRVFDEKREDLEGIFNKKASVKSTEYNPLMSQQAIQKAKTMMTPFVLRRKKAQVLKYLPTKSHEVIECEMTPTQREIYDDYIKKGQEARAERKRRQQEKDTSASTSASSSNVMMSLRKAAMHPLLFRRNYTDDTCKEMAASIMKEPTYAAANKEYIIEDMMVMSDYELNGLCEKFPNTMQKYILEKEKWFDSGKVREVLRLLNDVVERKEKILVFSLFTQMLDIFEKVLSFSNIAFVRLDGQTSVDTRQDIIDRFYEDETIPVFLLSTKAGGFGINLVAANNVVIFDQSFNPHDDKQAEDRAHRVGQTKEVAVWKLISKKSIDENILALAENKLQLDESISNENDTKIEEKAISMMESALFA